MALNQEFKKLILSGAYPENAYRRMVQTYPDNVLRLKTVEVLSYIYLLNIFTIIFFFLTIHI